MFPIRDTVPHRHAPVMTSLLIAATLLAFAFELSLSGREVEALVERCGLIPARYMHPEQARRIGLDPRDGWPFLTSLFLHGGWLHVFGNLWTLWIFGDNVEDRMGPSRFLIFYLLCGILAGVVHLVSAPDSMVPAIGASGAIAGVMGAYLVLYPRARVITLVPILFWPVFVELPAVFFLGVWFLLQFFSGTLALAGAPGEAGIAWWAHVGGFLAGIVLLGAFLRRRRAERPATQP
jgi:membrane associated rhomboid family serine protease